MSPYEKGGDRSRRPHLRGGDKGVRTPDLVTASHALSQLSYIPAGGRCWIRTSDPFRVKEVLYP